MKLINIKHVKQTALKIERDRFPNYPTLARTRVSNQFLEDCDIALLNFMRERIYCRANGKGKKTI